MASGSQTWSSMTPYSTTIRFSSVLPSSLIAAVSCRLDVVRPGPSDPVPTLNT
jgi:hypothetical protein